jgi:hypothetical protein
MVEQEILHLQALLRVAMGEPEQGVLCMDWLAAGVALMQQGLPQLLALEMEGPEQHLLFPVPL